MAGFASISTVPRSLSATVAATRATTPRAPAAWAMDTVSSRASSSDTAVAVTDCAVFQFIVVNVSDVGSTVTAPTSLLVTDKVTLAVGSASSATV